MKQIKIKTKRLENAIQKYFDFKYSLYRDYNRDGTCPAELQQEYENIKDNLLDMAHKENKSCAIVPGCFVLAEKMPSGKIRSTWVHLNCHFRQNTWEMIEHL